MIGISEKIAEKSNSLSVAQIRGIFAVLLENKGLSNNKLIQITGLPKEKLKEFKILAGFLLENSSENSITIRQEFIDQVTKEALGYSWSIATYADLQLSDAGLRDKISSIRSSQKLLPNRDLDQFFATLETSVAKALVLGKKGLLNISKHYNSPKITRLALLGDDDLVSISVGLLAPQNTEITVFEADQKLLTAIKEQSTLLGINSIQPVIYDARTSIPSRYYANFDAVVIDPPYTKEGVTLFLNRAIELLNLKTPKYIFLYYGTSPKTPEKTLKIQEIISQMGLVIEDKINNFARYDGAESIGSASSLYILKTTPFTRTLGRINDFSNLYTHQNVKEDKFPYVDHVVFKLYGVPKTTITSKTALARILGEFCAKHRLKVVDIKETKFKNGGLTITYVLASSNLVVHTWPELGAVHIDLITCSPIFEKEHLSENLYKSFGCKSLESNIIE